MQPQMVSHEVLVRPSPKSAESYHALHMKRHEDAVLDRAASTAVYRLSG